MYAYAFVRVCVCSIERERELHAGPPIEQQRGGLCGEDATGYVEAEGARHMWDKLIRIILGEEGAQRGVLGLAQSEACCYLGERRKRAHPMAELDGAP
jgi:hypothetical protein